MDAHHNLSEIYKKHNEEIIYYLKTKFDAELLTNKYSQEFTSSLILPLTVMNEVIEVIINIPYNFPDAFPQIKITQKSFKRFFPIPHLSFDGTLCLFDEAEATPNPSNKFGVVDEVLNKTITILTQGLLDSNKHDFIDEFEAYWWRESESAKYFSLVEPSNELKNIYLVPCTFKSKSQVGIFSDDIPRARRWINNSSGIIDEEAITEVIYLPLISPLSYPFPMNNIETVRLLTSNSDLNKLSFFKCLNKKDRPTKVLFSVKSDDGYLWGAWEYQIPFKQTISLYKGKKRSYRSLKGFRKESKNSQLELTRDFPHQKIKKYFIEDIRSSRLQRRGGDGESKNHEKRVALIGCGAVGSHIAQGLIDIGVEDLLLADFDTLKFENINRHFGGADMVGMLKTEAIQKKLSAHHPSIKIQTFNENILSLLVQYPDALNSYDLVICAIGHLPTEFRLNELQKMNYINTPVLNVWVEPYLAAGHAILINPRNGTDLHELFNNGIFKFQVLKNGDYYTKKELGCNTSYVPYGILNLRRFVNELVFFISDFWSNNKNDDILFTWLGNLSENRKENRLLEPRWVGAENFTSRQILLQENYNGECNE